MRVYKSITNQNLKQFSYTFFSQSTQTNAYQTKPNNVKTWSKKPNKNYKKLKIKLSLGYT